MLQFVNSSSKNLKVVQLFKVYDAIDVIGQIVNFGSIENKMIKGKDNMRLLIELRDQNSLLLKSGKRVEFNPNFTQPNMDLVDQFKI
ncbi:hypothetical protein IGI04_007346, partial [Brassica rapa subsp. trilocularis]